MLRYEINNDSIFYLGLKTYQQQYSKSVATLLDFKSVMESVSGLNLQVFFNQWFYGQGYPIFTIKYNQTGNSLFIKNTEAVSLSSATPFFKTHLDYLIHTTIGDTLIRLEQNQNVEFYTLEITGIVTGIEIDSKNWVVNKVNSIGIDTTLNIVEKESFQKYFLFPNPTKDILNFQNPINTIARIYNCNGTLIFRERISNFVDVKNLDSGFYFLEFQTSNGKINRIKFIKE
jgi:hypothetical protein